jgi:hypothetical protein
MLETAASHRMRTAQAYQAFAAFLSGVFDWNAVFDIHPTHITGSTASPELGDEGQL